MYHRLSLSIYLAMPGLLYVAMAFSEICTGNTDHKMINLSFAQLIIKSRLQHCYITTYMTVYWLLDSKV